MNGQCGVNLDRQWCTLAPDHEGDHQARGDNDRVIVSWPREAA